MAITRRGAVERTVAALTLGLGLFAACGKKATPTSDLDDARSALASAGHGLDGEVPADAARYSARRCSTGKVAGLDALACEYGDTAALAAARKQCESFIGDAVTGVAVARGRVMLVLVDRARIDPTGKTIHQILTKFR